MGKKRRMDSSVLHGREKVPQKKRPRLVFISLDVLQTFVAMMCVVGRSARDDKSSEFSCSVSGNQFRGKWLQSKSRLTRREASNIMFLTAEMGRWGGKLRILAKTGAVRVSCCTTGSFPGSSRPRWWRPWEGAN